VGTARCRPAEHEALLRYYPWLRTHVARQSRRLNLSVTDAEDAGQEAVFLLRTAIAAFDPRRSSLSCLGFVPFLRLVVNRWLSKFARCCRRAASKRVPLLQPDNCPAGVCPSARSPILLADERSDPQRIAQQRELAALLRREIGRLDPLTRALGNGLLRGESLRDLARTLEISYPRAKRLRRTMLLRLRRSFRAAP
jgi:DNA-directed RNA polymerase specialized sigma24 family protein